MATRSALTALTDSYFCYKIFKLKIVLIKFGTSEKHKCLADPFITAFWLDKR